MASEEKVIIGLVGPIAAGKGTIADFLEQKGFSVTSLSDRIREALHEEGKEITRKNLQEKADEMRQEEGPAVLAQRTWQILQKNKESRVVIDGIRGELEVDFLRTKPNFHLLGIRAERRQRFRWAKERNREGEPLTWEEFVAVDEKDFKSGSGKKGRDIEACLGKADYLIKNNGTISDLKNKMIKVLEKISKNNSSG